MVDISWANQHVQPSNPYIIEQYTVSNGLPTNTITDITLGHDGYLYLASNKGLIRMDGVHVNVFSVQSQSGFQSNRISRVFSFKVSLLIKDHLGKWYRFKSGKATPLLDPTTGNHIEASIVKLINEDQFLIMNQSMAYIVSKSSITTIPYPDSEYGLWDAELTADSTLFVLNTNGFYSVKNGSWKKIPIEDEYRPNLSFYSRLVLIDDHLRILGKQKSAAFDLESEEWCPEHSMVLNDRDTEIYNIKTYPEGSDNYLFGTSSGYFLQRNGQVEKIFEANKSLHFESVFKADKDDVLVAYDGVWINNALVFTPQSNIIDAVVDQNNGIWLSTAQEGLILIKKNKFTVYSNPQTINSYSVVKDRQGRFWAGSFENGVIRWGSDQTQLFTQKNTPFASNTIRMMAPLRNGGVLISVWGEPPFIIKQDKINQLTGFESLFGSRTNVTESFYEDSAGTWWLGTLDGLFIKKGKQYQPYLDSKKQTLSKVTRIVTSPFNDDLFFCTANQGLVLLRDSQFYFLSQDLGPTANHIRDVYVSTKDTVWAASYDSGIHRYITSDGSFSATVLSVDEGLMETGYHRIIADSSGYLWISSNSGLLRISERELHHSANNQSTVKALHWFDEDDGIPNVEFNGGTQSSGFRDDDGRIWFTNMNGIITFDPSSFGEPALNKQSVRVQLVQTQHREIEIHNNTKLNLSKYERSVEVTFAHIAPSNNQTEDIWYRVAHTTDEWSKTKQVGILTIDDLVHGENVIEFTSDPTKSLAMAQFLIVVEPFFYESSWFQIVILLLLIAGIGFGWRQRLVPSKLSPTNNSSNGQEFDSEPLVQTSTKKEAYSEPIKAFINEKYLDPDLSISMISEQLNMSRSTLYRLWNENNTESIIAYISRVRLEHAIKLIKEDDQMTITEAAHASGFSSQSYFSKVFKKEYGITPSAFLNKYDA